MPQSAWHGNDNEYTQSPHNWLKLTVARTCNLAITSRSINRTVRLPAESNKADLNKDEGPRRGKEVSEQIDERGKERSQR